MSMIIKVDGKSGIFLRDVIKQAHSLPLTSGPHQQKLISVFPNSAPQGLENKLPLFQGSIINISLYIKIIINALK